MTKQTNPALMADDEYAAYLMAQYPVTMAAHRAALLATFGFGGNGGPKDERQKNSDGSDVTFTDASGRTYTARTYNVMHEERLLKAALAQHAEPSGASWGGTETVA